MKKQIEIYTDGSSRGNPGMGGYGVVVMQDGVPMLIESRQFDNVTNNQMELSAILRALVLACRDYKDYKVSIYSDSAYCVNICNDWVYKWEKNGWSRSATKKQEIKNLELVQAIYYDFLSIDFPNFSIRKVRGHAGLLGNELADYAATGCKNKAEKALEQNYVTQCILDF